MLHPGLDKGGIARGVPDNDRDIVVDELRCFLRVVFNDSIGAGFAPEFAADDKSDTPVTANEMMIF